MMDISVVILGILDLRFGDIACVPSAPKPKKVLALLLIYRNQIVPVSALVEELWGNRPPASARTTLQTYILTLRKLLQAAAPSAGELLVTAGPGYMLRIPDDAVDLHRFGRLAKQGREAISRGDDETGVVLLSQALDLYRGQVLADVDTGQPVTAHVTRLEELRLTTLGLCIDAEMRLGRHQELLDGLATLTAHHRFHENLHAQYMRALWRSGRRSCALDVYQRLRRALAEELGMEPAWFLQQLQRAILSSASPQPQMLAGGMPYETAG
ncbi:MULTISPECIES: AfsR/SARP family transcriptional regulator [Streptomyces]|uniref:AfsR/SARP family transcriptional regulator n=2 Tax=Streptomyces TaxID=1883 RepID=A0ABY9JKR9_9ACTN|nr:MULTISPECIES: AfsR/SARP family transcriptional regulator [unclassified Streptomyces]WSQ81061.1 AfsR/SARP family transcriptional regulator [Streptomyces sp. NBC_01213]TXS10367.1 SARP family transcriptional regulator [Streptomyces sp. wa22]WLQ67720.1 AfsR/SARP family transcriptional regulator [Streptomyces sp. Alt3]WSQ88391.1 AfsR/SARP family transcriptional regulator [Streptomyces sp. NBC_01212]WSR51787.1 AfsR/SARP family transcriptional regulator [Streptomyces sp. NBC_01201]